jgi:hypothetical protein
MVKAGELYGLMQRIGTLDNMMYAVRYRSPKLCLRHNFAYTENVRRNANSFLYGVKQVVK